MEWVSVEDRLPEYENVILCYDQQRIYIAFRPNEIEYNEHWKICDDVCCSCNGCTGAVTHWIPLPEPPKE